MIASSHFTWLEKTVLSCICLPQQAPSASAAACCLLMPSSILVLHLTGNQIQMDEFITGFGPRARGVLDSSHYRSTLRSICFPPRRPHGKLGKITVTGPAGRSRPPLRNTGCPWRQWPWPYPWHFFPLYRLNCWMGLMEFSRRGPPFQPFPFAQFP